LARVSQPLICEGLTPINAGAMLLNESPGTDLLCYRGVRFLVPLFEGLTL